MSTCRMDNVSSGEGFFLGFRCWDKENTGFVTITLHKTWMRRKVFKSIGSDTMSGFCPLAWLLHHFVAFRQEIIGWNSPVITSNLPIFALKRYSIEVEKGSRLCFTSGWTGRHQISVLPFSFHNTKCSISCMKVIRWKHSLIPVRSPYHGLISMIIYPLVKFGNKPPQMINEHLERDSMDCWKSL